MQYADNHAERIIDFEGGHNFRDIGGYETRDGRRVARGLVYRSGTMAALSDADHDLMASLGLRAICDFRTVAEREHSPSRLRDPHLFEIWTRDYRKSSGELYRVAAMPGASAQDVREEMTAVYRRLAFEQAPAYRALFLRIANGTLPLVFHCSAGKDRTGVAAALLLDLLGVPRATIIEDYALTDRFFTRGLDLIAKNPIGDRLAGVPQDVWEPIMRADPVYLQAMFEAVKQRNGSTAGYLREELRLDDIALDTISARLLA